MQHTHACASKKLACSVARSRSIVVASSSSSAREKRGKTARGGTRAGCLESHADATLLSSTTMYPHRSQALTCPLSNPSPHILSRARAQEAAIVVGRKQERGNKRARQQRHPDPDNTAAATAWLWGGRGRGADISGPRRLARRPARPVPSSSPCARWSAVSGGVRWCLRVLDGRQIGASGQR